MRLSKAKFSACACYLFHVLAKQSMFSQYNYFGVRTVIIL